MSIIHLDKNIRDDKRFLRVFVEYLKYIKVKGYKTFLKKGKEGYDFDIAGLDLKKIEEIYKEK